MVLYALAAPWTLDFGSRVMPQASPAVVGAVFLFVPLNLLSLVWGRLLWRRSRAQAHDAKTVT